MLDSSWVVNALCLTHSTGTGKFFWQLTVLLLLRCYNPFFPIILRSEKKFGITDKPGMQKHCSTSRLHLIMQVIIPCIHVFKSGKPYLSNRCVNDAFIAILLPKTSAYLKQIKNTIHSKYTVGCKAFNCNRHVIYNDYYTSSIFDYHIVIPSFAPGIKAKNSIFF